MSEDVTITGALLAQDVVESFVLAGWLSHWALAAIALAALVILAALALLERRRGEPWWKLLLLYVCRGVAVVVVIWMLAQPAILSVITHRHPKSVAVLVDTSQSMSVSDAPTGAHTAQWALVRNGDQAGRPGTQADAALVALQLCRQQFARFSQAVTTATEHEQARTSAAQALDHARFAGDAMRRCGDRRTSLPSESVKRSRTLLERIEGELVSAVDRMVEDHTSGKLQLGGDLHARLNAIAQTIGQLIGEVRDLSEAIVEYERSDMDAALFDQPVYRMEAAADMTRRVAEQIRGGQADAAVLAFEFAREAKAIEPDTLTGLPPDQRQPEAQATDLAAALEHVAASTAQRRTAAVIMISDGGHNAAEDPLKTAAGLSDLPVYVLPVGNPRHVREVVVHQAKAPRTVFRNDDVAIEALVDAYASAGETLEVQLLQGDNVVDRDEVMISSDTFLHRVQFRQEALEIGRHEYVIRATPLTDERVTSNNAAQVAVDVIEQDIAVLLADRFARWEHRYLRNLLKRDERTEYDEVLFEPPPVRGRSDRAAGLPDTLEQWSRYRVVILGDLAPEHLSQKQQEQLEQYVGEQGGAIVLIAGRGCDARRVCGSATSADGAC